MPTTRGAENCEKWPHQWRHFRRHPGDIGDIGAPRTWRHWRHPPKGCLHVSIEARKCWRLSPLANGWQSLKNRAQPDAPMVGSKRKRMTAAGRCVSGAAPAHCGTWNRCDAKQRWTNAPTSPRLMRALIGPVVGAHARRGWRSSHAASGVVAGRQRSTRSATTWSCRVLVRT